MSRRAVRLAARFAARLDADLTIAHVVTWEALGREPRRLAMREMQAAFDQAGLALLEKMKAEAASAGAEADVALLHGRAAEAVNRFAADNKHDLILIGVRGRNAVSRLLLGSVADRIIRTATRPVLVVR
jgi:nucleotide-binding universal stress UspA family protein